MAVTRDGVPVRCWTFPGNTADSAIIRTVKDDLAGWNLRRCVWVADRGLASAANRAYLTRGGGHFIHAEKLRATNTEAAAALVRLGRYKTIAENLRIKEVSVAPGGGGDGDEGMRAQRFVVCHNPVQAERDAAVRANLVEHLRGLIAGSDAWSARLRDCECHAQAQPVRHRSNAPLSSAGHHQRGHVHVVHRVRVPIPRGTPSSNSLLRDFTDTARSPAGRPDPTYGASTPGTSGLTAPQVGSLADSGRLGKAGARRVGRLESSGGDVVCDV
jgi:hypothetical protein